MKVILDTNIVLVSASRHSPLNWVFQSLIEKKYKLCITTDILLEYEEIIGQFMGQNVAWNVLEMIVSLPNLEFTTIYYHWELIKADYDDNKFADCAIAGNVDYLVTNDKDFNILKKIDFPKINVINLDEFKAILFK